jgi:hypothetical protein
METDATADSRKWVLFSNQLPGLVKFPFLHQNHKPFDVIASGTGFVAGRSFDDVLGLEIPPGPRLIPEQGPRGDGNRGNILKTFESNFLFHVLFYSDLNVRIFFRHLAYPVNIPSSSWEGIKGRGPKGSLFCPPSPSTSKRGRGIGGEISIFGSPSAICH